MSRDVIALHAVWGCAACAQADRDNGVRGLADDRCWTCGGANAMHHGRDYFDAMGVDRRA